MTPDQFALNEYRDYVTYRELAKIETVPAFKRTLEELVRHEWEDFEFWRQFSPKKEFRLRPWELPVLLLMRRLLGLTFTAKYLERHEQRAVRDYTAYLKTANDPLRRRIQDILAREQEHEQTLIDQFRERRVQFLGSVVLGVNDGLIELTGALTGFAFALHDGRQVALFGSVTGIAASLSMAASAYMQARYEPGKDPRRAGLYTGLSYLLVVVGLILPFLLVPDVWAAFGIMMAVILALIAALSGYAAILFDRDFKRQFGEMLALSVGVAGIAFLLGSLVRRLLGS